jgi:RNA polymerase sigma-70 factor (ECF subfamily)
VSSQVSAEESVFPFVFPGDVPLRDSYGHQVECLFREHNESLLRYLRARLHSQDEAKEVAQEAYVQLLGLDHPEAVHFLQGYLFRTAANLATNRLKQRAQRRRDDELVFFESEDARSPERVWAADRKVASIRQALNELPANCREAFRLVKIEGLSSDEAADRLQLHPRRVRRYVARALAHCLACMEGASI